MLSKPSNVVLSAGIWYSQGVASPVRVVGNSSSLVKSKVIIERELFYPLTPRKSKKASELEMPDCEMNDSSLHAVKISQA